MESPDVTQDLEKLARNPVLRGVRPMIQNIEDDKWILQDNLNDAFICMQELGLCFDALILPKHIPHIIKIAERYPELPMIINHCAKPPIQQDQMEPWASQLKLAAQHPNVYCKLSGLLTEAGNNWSKEILYPYFDVIFEAFGSERIVWGSDWPVLLAAGSYGDWLTLCNDYITLNCPELKNKIFSENAIQFYNLTG
jgi:L-fuconolactonase